MQTEQLMSLLQSHHLYRDNCENKYDVDKPSYEGFFIVINVIQMLLNSVSLIVKEQRVTN